MVKITVNDGKEQRFESTDLEEDLRKAGLPERVAKEVVERVADRVQDGWTVDQVKHETDVELRRLQEEIDLAHSTYKGTTSLGAYNVGETRVTHEGDSSMNVQPRSETKVECRNVET